MTEYIQVSTTTANEAEANKIATALIDQRLAACVQIQGPLCSIYRWQGKVEQSQEWLCTAKTHQALFDQIASAIREQHSYDCPEIIATPLVASDNDYLAWLEQSLDRK
jgi:periplasmic divalent cation tolerance protein